MKKADNIGYYDQLRYKKIIDELGIRYVFVAKQTGINTGNLSNYLNGKIPMSERMKKKITDFIDRYNVKVK